MHVRTLGSGSAGNATLVRAGETSVLLDAGLPLPELEARLERARLPLHRLDHVVLTHGHLDHARSAGALARKSGATVHCAERLMRNASLRGAPRLATLPVNGAVRLAGRRGRDTVEIRTVLLPHDAHPTLGFRVEHGGRSLALVTDLGSFDAEVARVLANTGVLILEFNHDRELLRSGPYTRKLKRRVGGPKGHLSNEQAASMLRAMAGPELHTVVLAHLSATNNTLDRALAACDAVLTGLGRGDVRRIAAEQDEVGENLAV